MAGRARLRTNHLIERARANGALQALISHSKSGWSTPLKFPALAPKTVSSAARGGYARPVMVSALAPLGNAVADVATFADDTVSCYVEGGKAVGILCQVRRIRSTHAYELQLQSPASAAPTLPASQLSDPSPPRPMKRTLSARWSRPKAMPPAFG